MPNFLTGCDIAGDGYCDDATNDGRCNFDGGDCCVPDKNTEYCQFCLCYADQPEGNLNLFLQIAVYYSWDELFIISQLAGHTQI